MTRSIVCALVVSTILAMGQACYAGEDAPKDKAGTRGEPPPHSGYDSEEFEKPIS